MTENRMIVCPECGGVNRVPAARDAKAAKCGACSKPLFDGHPRDVDARLFDRHVSRASIPVLVDVWAPWCGPCRMMTPAFEAAAGQLEPSIRLIKLNSDAEQALAGRLGIRGIPTLLLYAGGREIARQSGAMTTGQIAGWVQDRLRGTGHAA